MPEAAKAAENNAAPAAQVAVSNAEPEEPEAASNAAVAARVADCIAAPSQALVFAFAEALPSAASHPRARAALVSPDSAPLPPGGSVALEHSCPLTSNPDSGCPEHPLPEAFHLCRSLSRDQTLARESLVCPQSDSSARLHPDFLPSQFFGGQSAQVAHPA
jgi:hypothetical protein